MKGFLSNPLIKFTVLASSLYLSWYVLYEFVLKLHSDFDSVIINNLVILSRKGLSAIGFETMDTVTDGFQNMVQISDTLGVRVGAPCDGIVLLALFTVFIVAFPGPWKHKAWYLPAGLIAIHLINVLRIMALVLIVNKNPDWLQFNHDYTFTILVYAFVFALWMIWVYKFSPLKGLKNEETTD